VRQRSFELGSIEQARIEQAVVNRSESSQAVLS